MAGGDFAKQAAQTAGQIQTATLHGVDERSGDIVVSSWADVVSGSSISVYKTPDFNFNIYHFLADTLFIRIAAAIKTKLVIKSQILGL